MQVITVRITTDSSYPLLPEDIKNAIEESLNPFGLSPHKTDVKVEVIQPIRISYDGN